MDDPCYSKAIGIRRPPIPPTYWPMLVPPWIDQYGFVHPFRCLFEISRRHFNPLVENSTRVVLRGVFIYVWAVKFYSCHSMGMDLLSCYLLNLVYKSLYYMCQRLYETTSTHEFAPLKRHEFVMTSLGGPLAVARLVGVVSRAPTRN